MCLGVGQKVRSLDKRSISSSVIVTFERLITVDVSRRIGVLFLEKELDRRTLRGFLRLFLVLSSYSGIPRMQLKLCSARPQRQTDEWCQISCRPGSINLFQMQNIHGRRILK